MHTPEHAPLTLADGTTLQVRQLTGADGPALARAVERLSDESRYMRFASPMPRLSPRLIQQLTVLDHIHQEALLVVDPDTRDGVAVARFAEDFDDSGVVDIALTVDDDWQSKGVGSQLLSRILDRARATGHKTALAEILAENTRSLRLFEGAGFRRRGPSGTMLELAFELCRDDANTLSPLQAPRGSDTVHQPRDTNGPSSSGS